MRRATHHTNVRCRTTAAGTIVYDVARPLRAAGWTQWRRQRVCRKATGHCWHPAENSLVDWWCCMCSGETEGMPADKCKHCAKGGHSNG